MCGIAGELRFSAGGSRADWEQISAMMARRGPDDAGLWSDDDYCTLAFRRLAILDLSPTGKQPMLSADGRFALVYNGEMYNYLELRAALEALGYRFRSSGDTEVVLYALAEWGAAALARFNGMFALAFYDMAEKTLLLSRDHAGIKPLYIMQTAQGLMFASQYNQLLAHPWRAGLKIQAEALALYLQHLYIPAPYALLENTAMLEAGAWLKINVEGRIEQGYHFRWEDQPKDLRGAEALAAVDAAITDAVQRQLISDVPLGTFLSGGIDSPLVTAKAQQIVNQPLRAYSIGAPNYEGDESAEASAYAQALGVQHILEAYTPAQMLQNLDHIIAASTEPFADYSLFPTMKVAELARRDVTVILSGDGGDELFWGYTRSLLQLKYTPLYRLPYALRQRVLPPALRLLKRDYLSERLGYQDMGAWFFQDHAQFLQNQTLTGLFPALGDHLPQATPYRSKGRDQVADWLRQAEFERYLPGVLLKVDRGSMYHSLEVRVPLLDKVVIETAQRIDWMSCVDLPSQQGKQPLREALKRYAKPTTYKRGFDVPMQTWLREDLRPIFEEQVLGRREILGFEMNQTALRRLYQAHLDGDVQNLGMRSSGLWALLSLSLWEQKHYI